MTVNFSIRMGKKPGTNDDIKSVELSLTRRQQVFAPFEADIALQDTSYDLPVVVTK